MFVWANLFVCAQSCVDSIIGPPNKEQINPAASLNLGSKELISFNESLRFKYSPWCDTLNNEFISIKESTSLSSLKKADGHLSQIPTTPNYAEIDFHGLKTWVTPVSVETLSTLFFESTDSSRWISIYGHHQSAHDVLCLTVDEDDLFSDSLGIMVPGIRYENSERTGNYHLRGKQSERDAYLHYFTPDSLLFAMPIHIRIHGGLQRGAMQKSIRLYFPGDEKKNEFFPESQRSTFDQLVLRNGNSAGNGTHITDAFIHACAPKSNLISNPSRPVELFINGEYWGFYHLRHRNNEETIQAALGLTDPIHLYDEKVLTDATFNTPIDSLAEEIGQLDVNTEEDWTKLADLLDIENVTDYILINTFFSNQDWIINNVKVYRHPSTGKWCFLLDDMDACMKDGPEVNIFENIDKTHGCYAEIFKKLLSCPRFTSLIWKRYRELKASSWSAETLKRKHLHWLQDHEQLIQAHRLRWKPSFIHEDLKRSQIASLTFLSHRHYFFEDQLSEYGSGSADSSLWALIVVLVLALVFGLLAFVAKIPLLLKNIFLLLGQWIAMFSAVGFVCPEGLNFSLFVLADSFLSPTTWLLESLSFTTMDSGSTGFIVSIVLVLVLCAWALATMLTELNVSRFILCFIGFLSPLYFILLPSADWVLFVLSAIFIVAYRRQNKFGIAFVLFLVGLALPIGLLMLPALFLTEMITSSSRREVLKNFTMYTLATFVGEGIGALFLSDSWLTQGSTLLGHFHWPQLPFMSGTVFPTLFLDAVAVSISIFCVFTLLYYFIKRLKGQIQENRELVLSIGVLASVFLFAFCTGDQSMVKRLVLSSGFIFVLIANFWQYSSRVTYFIPLFFMLTFLLFGSYTHILIQIKFTLLALFLGSFFLVYRENKLIRNTFRVLQLVGMAFAQWYFLLQWFCSGPVQ